MKKIERKLFGKIEFAHIDDYIYWERLIEKEQKPEYPKCEWLFDEINEIKFKFPISDNSIIADFIIGRSMPICAISERVYKYLFIDNPEMSSNLLSKKIKLINDDTWQRKSNEDEVGQYYLITPKKLFIENEKDQINGIAWRVEKSLYKIDDITLHNFYFCLSDNFAKDFKAQKFTGIVINKDEKIEIIEPENIYYESTETDVVKKITNFLQEVSKKKILKSKCKYIYYTIMEETNGYALGVAGYMNKYFDDETFSFDPNICDLTTTNLEKFEWEECLIRLKNILKEIYIKKDNDFFKIKAFIGFHDGDIYNIN